jgi:Peptidase A4 family
MSARSGRSVTLLSAGSALLAVLATAHPAGAADSGDLGGYAATGGKFASVSTSWVLPTAHCTGTTSTYTSIWDGLDGFDNSALEQTGTDADCVNGQAEYEAWWEVYPSAETLYSVALHPGDHITATVAYDGTSTFTMTLTDSTQGWTKTTKHASTAGQGASAEVFVEIPTTAPPAGSVTFTGTTANGQSLAAFSPTAYVLPGGTTSPITSGTFTVTWS